MRTGFCCCAGPPMAPRFWCARRPRAGGQLARLLGTIRVGGCCLARRMARPVSSPCLLETGIKSVMLRHYNLAFARFPAAQRSLEMKIADVRARAFAMPLNNPSYPPGPYRFYDREYFVVEYLTDPTALRAVVPEPLEISDPIVKFEFIRLPD